MNAKYNVGDVLRFKTIEEIFDEFGHYDAHNEINSIPAGFNKNMEHMCGKVFTVKSVTEGFQYMHYRSEEGIENNRDGGSGHWIVTAEMLTPDESPTKDICEDDFLSILEA